MQGLTPIIIVFFIFSGIGEVSRHLLGLVGL